MKWKKSKHISFEEKFEQKLSKLLFSKEKAMHFFCFYKYFLLLYPIKLLEFFWKLVQPIISFLINMKNLKSDFFFKWIIDLCIYLFSSIEDLQPQETEPTDDSVTYHVSSTSTLVIRKESSDSSHECIILDVIHHVLIKNICTCAV